MSAQFGPYRLERLIGEGGMGEVWAALHTDLEMPCAIKRLSRDSQRDPKCRKMFLNEALICAQLRYGGIVKVCDSGIIDGRPYIAMDLIDGMNLREFTRALGSQRGVRLPVPLVAHITGQVLEALDYAHRRTIRAREGGVIHGDISPGNILISSQGEVLLTDFGLASFVSSASLQEYPAGTPPYMAPEQVMGCMCRRSDLYSVGAVLHEMLTGDTPLPRRTSIRDLVELFRERSLPSTGRKDVPAPLERLRRGLLEKHVDRRIPTTGEALDLLDDYRDYRDYSQELRRLYRRHFGRARFRLGSPARRPAPVRGEARGEAPGEDRARPGPLRRVQSLLSEFTSVGVDCY